MRLSDLFGDEDPNEVRKSAGRLSLEDVFDEEPVPLDVFITDPYYLGSPRLGPIQYEAVRHIERIYYEDLYPQMGEHFDPYWAAPVRMTNLITLQWGKGSGKDHICRIASLRIAYLLLCLKSPQTYYGIPTQDTIHMLNIASNANQANTAFFSPMTRVVKRGWWKDKCEPKQGLIEFHKNVEAISGHSNAESQEGLNLMLGIADEIDAFKSKAEQEQFRPNSIRDSPTSAEAVLKMIQSSASTRFMETYKNVRISFPRYLGSTIQKLTQEANEDIEKRGEEHSRHYVSGPLATWDVNPRYDRSPRTEVTVGSEKISIPTIGDFVDEYEKDPANARGKFECKPSRAVDSYFKNPEQIQAALIGTDDPAEKAVTFEYTLEEVRSARTDRVSSNWSPIYTFHPEFKPIVGARYAIHCDMAIKGDRAGIAMSHVAAWERGIETVLNEEDQPIEMPYERPIVKTDFVISFGADLRSTPVREIQIRWARELVFQLLKDGFPVERVSYDGFQSDDSLQILDAHGIEAEKFSVDRTEAPWRTMRDLLAEGRLTMPYSIKLLDELESLGRFGGKVDHPAGGSKDEADAVCGSVTGAILLGGEEDPEGAVAYPGGDEIEVGGQFLEEDFIDYAGDPMALPVGLDYSMIKY